MDKKRFARKAVKIFKKKGLLTMPDKCENCNSSHRPLHAHHPDYDQPVEVVFLCPVCHTQLHSFDRDTWERTKRPETVYVSFTPGEKMRLKLLADEVGVSMADMVRYMVAERILNRKLADHPTVIKSLKVDAAPKGN